MEWRRSGRRIAELERSQKISQWVNRCAIMISSNLRGLGECCSDVFEAVKGQRVQSERALSLRFGDEKNDG